MSVVADQPDHIIPKSVLRHRPTGETRIPVSILTPRSSRAKEQREPHTTGGLPSVALKGQPQRQVHWLVPGGIAMASTVLLILCMQIAFAWGTITLDDLRYGRPRTFQMDAVVGHQDSVQNPTHLVAFNLSGQIQILELPGGDSSRARMIVGPRLTGPGADLVPVRLRLADRDGDHLVDLVVQCGSLEVWFRNDKAAFLPQ